MVAGTPCHRVLQLALCLVVAGCNPTPEEGTRSWQDATWPEPLEGGAVVRWRVQDGWGVESYELQQDGNSLHELRGVGPAVAVTARIDTIRMEMLRDQLVYAHCCELGGPHAESANEGRLELRMPELECDIVLPTATWDLDPAARACEEPLRRVLVRTRPTTQMIAPAEGSPEPAAEQGREAEEEVEPEAEVSP